MTDINTIHWLPAHIAGMREFQEITKAYDYLLQRAFTDLEKVFNNQFLERLDETGCAMHEKVLGILPDTADTLDDRKRRIKGYYASDLPYTENKLRAVLGIMCGAGQFTLDVNGACYQMTVKIIDHDIRLARNVYDVVSFMKPANILLLFYAVYRSSFHVDVSSRVAGIRFATVFYPRLNLPELYLDSTWELDGGRELDGYDGGEAVDLNPVRAAFRSAVRVDTGTENRIRIKGKTRVDTGTATAVRISGKAVQKTGAGVRTRICFSVEHHIGVKAAMHQENDLDGEWLLDGSRDLDGGTYEL